MDKRSSSEFVDDRGRDAADPLRRLQEELSRLRTVPGDDANKDAVIARLLAALGEIGEALQPLIRSGGSTAPPPAAPVLAFRRGPREAEETETKGPVVLVIEPEPSVNDYIRSTLARNGFDPISFPTVEEAVERARAFPPDAVTIDHLVLRHGNENWLVRFKTDPVLAPIPIVLVRAPDEDDPVHPFGIAAEVTKPIDGEELVRALTVLCRSGDEPEPGPAGTDDEPPAAPRVVRG